MANAETPVCHYVRQRIGKNVLRIRGGNKTQLEVATATGISQPVLSRIEKGSYPGLSMETLCRLALGLDCRLSDLLDDIDMAFEITKRDLR